jgi:uncharacterized protein YaeQ
MKIRASIHLGEKSSTIQLFPVLQETNEHLILKLTAAVFFHQQEPIVVTSPQQHSALAGQDFAPDLMAVDLTNQVTLWLECGKTTLHKLDKVSKRFRTARIVMITALPREGEQMAETLRGAGIDRVEVWSFRYGEFDRWRSLIQEQNDIIGEATETSMNLVINGQVFMTELKRVR